MRPNSDRALFGLRAIAAAATIAGTSAIGPSEISPAAPAAPTAAHAQNHPQRVRCDGWLDDEIAGSGTLATLRRVNVYLQHAGRFPFDRRGAALTRA